MDVGLTKFPQAGTNCKSFFFNTITSILVVVVTGWYCRDFSQAKASTSDQDVMGFGVRRYVMLAKKQRA